MTVESFRLPSGGAVDRSRPLAFTFDGKPFTGLAGDTLASALLANGVRLVGRSFKYHRPRGIYTAGPEEPNALIQLRSGERTEPNTRATMIELFDGLDAESQNRWPSLEYDVGAINSLLSPFFPAGFYYKTFMWPADRWEDYEKVIRAAAGLGKGTTLSDPDSYDRRFTHCDVLVVGGGVAGLAAALAAGRTGARVVLVDETASFGGYLRSCPTMIDGKPSADWIAQTLAELGQQKETRLLSRTTAFAYYDHNMMIAVERVADHLASPPPFAPRQRLWNIRAKRIVLATGSIERPLVFAENDRPGVMLASAARVYARRYGVLAGRRAVVFANNDSAYDTAVDLAQAGCEIAAIVDPREVVTGGAPDRARQAGIKVLTGHVVASARGGSAVTGADVVRLDRPGTIVEQIRCDLLAVSGGWTPSVHLHCQAQGKPVWEPSIAAFVPGPSRQAERSAGAARGRFGLAACLADGLEAGAVAAHEAGFGSGAVPPTPAVDTEGESPLQPLWQVKLPSARGKRFVDIQDDVTADDVALAAREGYVSVEHLKRYTTLGMGTDQGKTSNINGLAILAGIREEEIPKVGVTTFRPPYTPVTVGAIVGRDIHQHFEPTRRTPMHDWHDAHGCVWMEAGLWKRPRYYPQAGEDIMASFIRETNTVRNGVGMVDVSTLGKIDVQGPDAAEFLERVYTGSWKNLPVGRARYGLMLREDGVVFDDGTTSRIGENHFFMTTTTASAVPVMAHLEYLLQVIWPDLRVLVTSVSDQWAGIALSGPHARKVLERVVDDIDMSNEAFPFMGVREGHIAGGIPARLFRISFSGELAWEVTVPSDYGYAAWQALMDVGASLGLIAYGMETLGGMRIEKGHVAGNELDGRTTAEDLGLGKMVSKKKPFFIGRALLERPAMKDPARKRLVGLLPVDRTQRIKAGMQLVVDPDAPKPIPMLGHVTSNTYSPTLGHSIGLALLSGGLERKGQRLWGLSPTQHLKVEVEVVDPVFLDPAGERLHA